MDFTKKVETLLEQKPSLHRFLFEDKEEEKDSGGAGGLFDMDDDSESDDESGDAKSSDEETADDESADSDEPVESEEDSTDELSSETTEQQIETLTTQIEAIRNTIDKVNSDDGTQSIESFIAGAISSDVNESFVYSNKSIGSFLLVEDKNLSSVEKDIDVLDRVLTKGTALVNKFKKGKEINIDSYVSAAINAYKNFDNLFAKEKIIKQATINVLILNSGANAESNIKEFEELFHEELSRQFGIEYPEFALVTKKHNAAVGAVKQG